MTTCAPQPSVHGLEAIIDAMAGVLAEQSLEATLQAMARALAPIVPFTSLAVFELSDDRATLVPVFAEGLWVAETLADRPSVQGSISGKAVLSGEVYNLAPDHPWIREHQIPGTPDDEGEAFLVAPLMAGDRAIGTLNVWREQQDDARFGDDEAELVRRFATLAAIAYANARQRELLRTQALTDDLTGLYNRRHFFERLTGELARRAREGTDVALVLLDVDDFKAINDRHGHPAGDECLRRFSRALEAESRASDVVCRTGGEEFTIILPDADADEAARYAERVRVAVHAVECPDGVRLTTSVGVATAAADGNELELLCRVADDRLLHAKQTGKDRVVTG
jgi:diguanylate cyclase (GGDEF)-like protein